MSRLQSHKKSQSTSALSTIASGSNEKPSSRLRRSQHPTRTLGRVEEGELNSASLSKLPGLSTPGRSVGMKDGRRERVVGTMEDVGGWLNDVRSCGLHSRSTRPRTGTGLFADLSQVQSLRSSDRRRLAALKGMEKMLVDFCRADKHSSRSSPSLEELVDLQSEPLQIAKALRIVGDRLIRSSLQRSPVSAHTPRPDSDSTTFRTSNERRDLGNSG